MPFSSTRCDLRDISDIVWKTYTEFQQAANRSVLIPAADFRERCEASRLSTTGECRLLSFYGRARRARIFESFSLFGRSIKVRFFRFFNVGCWRAKANELKSHTKNLSIYETLNNIDTRSKLQSSTRRKWMFLIFSFRFFFTRARL